MKITHDPDRKFGDAREEELAFLLQCDSADGNVSVGADNSTSAHRDMVAELLYEGLLYGPGAVFSSGKSNEFHLVRGEIGHERDRKLADYLSGKVAAELRLSHKGRVRISELRQALRSDRIRDAMGVLFDGRHADQALRLAVIEVTPSAPLSVGVLDVNGLKAANDSHGHAAGDLLLRAYLTAIAAAVEDRGEAFRTGGDEVLVLLPNHDLVAAEKVIRRAHGLLGSERLVYEGKTLPRVTMSVGLAIVTKPEDGPDVRRRADELMYRAKTDSKKARGTTPTVLALQERAKVEVLEE